MESGLTKQIQPTQYRAAPIVALWYQSADLWRYVLKGGWDETRV